MSFVNLGGGGGQLLIDPDDKLLIDASAALVISPSSGLHATDWRECRRGRKPDDWRELFGLETDIRVEGSTVDLSHRSYLQLTGRSDLGVRILAWDAPDADPNRPDQESCCVFRVAQQVSTTLSLLVLRASVAGGLETSYRLRLLWSAQQIEFSRVVNGVVTSLLVNSTTLRVGIFYYARFRVTSDTLYVRIWRAGDTEPAIWDTSLVDPSPIADGSIGVQATSATDVIEMPFFAAATDGQTAQVESDLPEPLDVWISELQEEMEFTARCEYYNPDAGEVQSTWVSSHGRITGATDYPPNTVMEPLLRDAGTLTARLEADASLGGIAIPALSALRLDNRPTHTATAGPLDDWQRYSFHGRPVEVRGGKRWLVKPSGAHPGTLNPHRRFEILGPAVASHEPEVRGEEVQLPLAAPVSLLSERVPVYRNIGIATGIKNLTSSGWLSIPSNAAYDLTSYTIYVRLYIPSGGFAGTGLAEITKRESGLGYLTWYMAVFQASHATSPNQLRFAVHNDTGAIIIASNLSLATFLGGWVNIIFGVKGSDRWYGIVNDDLITGGIITTNPSPNSGSIVRVMGSGIVGGVVCDHRIEKWVDEDEARARFSARRDPDSLTISMHRGDEITTSATVTDYAPLANHGTLQGTDAVDRERTPTYLGSVEVAGISMPFAGGVLYHAPTQTIDPVRNIFRYRDRVKTSGSAVEVRAQGVVLTGGGTNYNEPTAGPGTVDMTAAVSQPVTFGMTASPASPENVAIHVPRLVRNELTDRGALDATTADLESFDGLRALLPMRGGFFYGEPPTIADFLAQQLGPLAAYFTLDRHGRATVGCTLPTLLPGPYDMEPMLEFIGLPNRGVTFSPNAAFNLNNTLTGGVPWFGVAAWIKVPTRMPIDPSAVMGTYFPAGMTIIDRVDGASGYYLGIDGRDGGVVFGAPGVTSTGTGLHYLKYAYPFEANKPYFIFGTQDSNTRSIGVYSLDDPSIALLTSTSELTTGGMTVASSAPLRIGHGPQGSMYGWIGRVLGSSAPLGQSDFVDAAGSDTFNIRTTPFDQSTVSSSRWDRTRFHIPLTEGSGDVAVETKTGLQGRLEGVRWCPKLILDFRTAATPSMPGVLRSRPAWRVDARFKINHRPLSGADVAASVSASDRVALGQAYLSEPDISQNVRHNYHNSHDISISTPVLSQADADFIARLLRYRLSTDRRLANALSWYRDMLRLGLTDEVLLYDDRFDLDVGRPMRVVTLVANLGDLTGDVGMWG